MFMDNDDMEVDDLVAEVSYPRGRGWDKNPNMLLGVSA
jgi:hypothetical protein